MIQEARCKVCGKRVDYLGERTLQINPKTGVLAGFFLCDDCKRKHEANLRKA